MSGTGLSSWTEKKDTRQKIGGSISVNPIPPAEVSLGKILNAKLLPTAGSVWLIGFVIEKVLPIDAVFECVCEWVNG